MNLTPGEGEIATGVESSTRPHMTSVDNRPNGTGEHLNLRSVHENQRSQSRPPSTQNIPMNTSYNSNTRQGPPVPIIQERRNPPPPDTEYDGRNTRPGV